MKQSGLPARRIWFLCVLSTVEQANVFVLLCSVACSLSLNCRRGRPIRCWRVIISISPSVKDLVSFYALTLSHARTHKSTSTSTHTHTHTHASARTHAQMAKEMAHQKRQVTAREVWAIAAEQMNHVMELERTAVGRDPRRHSLRRAVVIDPDPGVLSRRRGPHVYRCNRQVVAAGRRKQHLRGLG